MVTQESISHTEGLIEIEGIERFMTVAPNMSTKIAHVFAMEGPIDYVIEQLPRAFLAVINQHPKMRAKQSKTDAFKAIICPPLSLNQVTPLIRIIREPIDWTVFVPEECDQPINRQDEFPFYLTVIKESDQQCRLIIFSDHYMSDGHSGMVIMDGILKQLVHEHEVATASLYPSAFSKMVPSRLQKWMDYSFLTLILPILQGEMNKRKFHLPIFGSGPILKLPLPPNAVPCPSFAKFATGTNENYIKIKAKCKEENVTLHGPIVAAIQLVLAAIASVKEEKFKCTIEVAINMRKRYSKPIKDDAIGMNIESHFLEYFEKKGFSLNDKFWDIARLCKKETDKNNFGPINRAIFQFIHEKMTVKSPSLGLKLDRGTMIDLGVSNIGKYPFSLSHTLPLGPLTLKSVHLYNNFPTFGPTACFFITCTEHLGYSISHRTNEPIGTRLFEHAVHMMENLWLIDSNETMSQVIQRFSVY